MGRGSGAGAQDADLKGLRCTDAIHAAAHKTAPLRGILCKYAALCAPQENSLTGEGALNKKKGMHHVAIFDIVSVNELDSLLKLSALSSLPPALTAAGRVEAAVLWPPSTSDGRTSSAGTSRKVMTLAPLAERRRLVVSTLAISFLPISGNGDSSHRSYFWRRVSVGNGASQRLTIQRRVMKN